jgi:hypothetical protein
MLLGLRSQQYLLLLLLLLLWLQLWILQRQKAGLENCCPTATFNA